MAERILLLGSNGQVGHELKRALPPLGSVVALARADADLSAPDSLRAIVREVNPTIIVNAAAYTAVDRAESEPQIAQAVNAWSPRVLGEEAQATGALLVHYSTDYVFDGSRRGAYTESDPTHPLSVYGRSKLDGENGLARACRRHLILRTSWVYGAHGTNFLKTMLRLAAERESLKVVADQTGAPTGAALIADTTASLLQALKQARPDDLRFGCYHLTASGSTSWQGYAQYVIGQAAARGASLKCRPEAVLPIATHEYPVAATRPANSVLSTAKLRDTFGLSLPDWRHGVDEVLSSLLQPAAADQLFPQGTAT
jgi:dTDP-4-dehydrorhamnose reductase